MSNYILQTKGICKSFGGTKALKGVDFNLRHGEIHGLIGENGAGKSTLIKIIAGYYTKDEGVIEIDGAEQHITKPADSLSLGIRVISQEFNLMNDMTVAENICIGDYPRHNGLLGSIVDRKKMNAMSAEVLAQIGEQINPTTAVKHLSVAEQQIVEIAKALWRKPKILIMDEPTAALNTQETEHLFNLLRRLKNQGVSIIFITHRLQEQFELSERITVLRNGELVGTINTCDATPDKLATMMVGKNISANYSKSKGNVGEVIYETKGLCIGRRIQDVSFQVRRGEIVSIFGLLGQGQDTLSRALIGDVRLESGEIWISGKKANLRTPKDAIKNGVGFVSDDRKKAGLLLLQTLERNVSISSMSKLSRYGVVNRRKEANLVNAWVQKLRIKCSSINQSIVSLSGGNQQKALIARWLANDSEFIILNLPTRGVDVGAKYDIYYILEELCKTGVGVLVISLELPEVLGISDRVLVMRDGQLVADFANDGTLDSDTIMAAAVGSLSVNKT